MAPDWENAVTFPTVVVAADAGVGAKATRAVPRSEAAARIRGTCPRSRRVSVRMPDIEARSECDVQ
ncbi:hypothetical protein GCM10009838_79320 [Catenulispora subtropica]|uniref:Uncharacterized protein n=1 Tax=Catenulispora subtropica TaxID=450798 RepID=A0ABN2T8J7_9ACTN